MSRSGVTVAVLLAVAALGALFLVVDPLHVLGGARDDAKQGEDAELGSGGPHLEGLKKAPLRLPTEVNGEPVGVLRLTLGTAALQGTVTGQGEPLALARVQPVLPPPLPAVAVRTDAKGHWEVRGLPAGAFELRVSADGYRGRTAVAPALLAGETKVVPAVDLVQRSARLDGLLVKVTDLEGRPIPGAKVLATSMSWAVHLAVGAERAGYRDVQSKSAVADERGEALLEGLAPEEYDVVATATGRAAMAIEGVQVARGRLERMTIRLAPGVSISGKLVDAGGKPVADGFVFGLHQPTWAAAVAVRSDKEGMFSLDGLRAGSYMVIAGSDDAGSAVRNGVPSPSKDVTLELKGAGRLVGTVTDAMGKPVTSFTVRPSATQPFGYEYSRVYTFKDPEGKFAIGLAATNYELRVTTDDGGVTRIDKVTVEGGETTKVDIKVAVSGVVKGVVTDPKGDHLEGAEVFVNLGGMPGGPVRENHARTDPDGRFAVKGLALETVTLHVRHPGWADTKWTGKAVVADQAAEVTIAMGGGAQIAGRVTRADGGSAGGEQVNLYVGWFDSRTTFCDGEGRYSFDHVAAGKWNLTTGVFENGADGLSRMNVDVPAEGTVTIDFAYAQGAGGTVTGTVLVGGKPAVGATVRVSNDSDSAKALSLKTDAQGTFRAEGLAIGRAEVEVETAEGLTAARGVRIDPETKTGNIIIDFGTTTVRGSLLGADGTQVGNAWITAERVDPSSATGFTGVSNKSVGPDGSFEMKGLQAGTYQLRIWAGGYAQITTPTFTLAESESRDMGRITVPRGADIAGRVTDDAGQPVENATISLKDLEGKPLFSFSLYTTGSDGRYTVQGVLPGRYVVSADARGHAPAQREAAVGADGATVDLVLSRGGSIRVRVVDDTGAVLEDARIVLLDARGERVTRTLSLVNWFEGGRDRTKADGEATIPDLAAGTYRVRAEKAGLAVVGEEPSVSVVPGSTATAMVTLAAAPK
jgi:hypothetical protein